MRRARGPRTVVKDIEFSLTDGDSSKYKPYASAITDHIFELSEYVGGMCENFEAQPGSRSISETVNVHIRNKLNATRARLTISYFHKLGVFIGDQQSAFRDRLEDWQSDMFTQYRLTEKDRRYPQWVSRQVLATRMFSAGAEDYLQLSRTYTGLRMLAKSAIKFTGAAGDSAWEEQWKEWDSTKFRDNLQLSLTTSRELAEFAKQNAQTMENSVDANDWAELKAEPSTALLAAIPTMRDERAANSKREAAAAKQRDSRKGPSHAEDTSNESEPSSDEEDTPLRSGNASSLRGEFWPRKGLDDALHQNQQDASMIGQQSDDGETWKTVGQKGKAIRPALPHRIRTQAESPAKTPRKTETSFTLDSSNHARWPNLAGPSSQASRQNKGTVTASSHTGDNPQIARHAVDNKDEDQEKADEEEEDEENEEEETEDEEERYNLLATMEYKGAHRQDGTVSDSEV